MGPPSIMFAVSRCVGADFNHIGPINSVNVGVIFVSGECALNHFSFCSLR